MDAFLFGVGVQNLIIPDVNANMADVQPACAEEQQIPFAQFV